MNFSPLKRRIKDSTFTVVYVRLKYRLISVANFKSNMKVFLNPNNRSKIHCLTQIVALTCTKYHVRHLTVVIYQCDVFDILSSPLVQFRGFQFKISPVFVILLFFGFPNSRVFINLELVLMFSKLITFDIFLLQLSEGSFRYEKS